MKDLLIETVVSVIRQRMEQGCTDIKLCYADGRFIWFSMKYNSDAGYWYVHCGRNDSGSIGNYAKAFGIDNIEEALVKMAECIEPYNLKFPDNYQSTILGTILPPFLSDHTYPKTGAMYREDGIHINYGHRRNGMPYSSIAYK